jgi:hypothetical protein
MPVFWPGVGPQSAWTFSGFAWLPGNRLAINQPWQTDIATLTCASLDASINEGDVCAVQMALTSLEATGGIQVSIKGGDWADLEFDEGESVSSAASATAGDGEGLRLRGGTTGGPASLIATVNDINVSVADE